VDIDDVDVGDVEKWEVMIHKMKEMERRMNVARRCVMVRTEL